jgi:PEP-CTERM motif
MIRKNVQPPGRRAICNVGLKQNCRKDALVVLSSTLSKRLSRKRAITFLKPVIAALVVGLLNLTDAVGASIPFDVTNATVRPVQLWTDIDEDPGVVHGTMVPVALGAWGVSGQTGTVTVPVATMEALVVGDGSTSVPGSVTPLTIEINLATLVVQRITFSGRLTGTVLGDVDFEYVLQSNPGPWTLPSGVVVPGALGGFSPVFNVGPVPQIDGFTSELFPAPGVPYTIVPTENYDPSTGLFNAVGPNRAVTSVAGTVFFFDQAFGDLRLTEVERAVPEPASLFLLGAGLILCTAAIRRMKA